MTDFPCFPQRPPVHRWMMDAWADGRTGIKAERIGHGGQSPRAEKQGKPRSRRKKRRGEVKPNCGFSLLSLLLILFSAVYHYKIAYQGDEEERRRRRMFSRQAGRKAGPLNLSSIDKTNMNEEQNHRALQQHFLQFAQFASVAPALTRGGIGTFKDTFSQPGNFFFRTPQPCCFVCAKKTILLLREEAKFLIRREGSSCWNGRCSLLSSHRPLWARKG